MFRSVYLLLLKTKSSPDKTAEIFSVLALKTRLNITARGRIMFAAVCSLISILLSKQDSLQVAHEEGGQWIWKYNTWRSRGTAAACRRETFGLGFSTVTGKDGKQSCRVAVLTTMTMTISLEYDIVGFLRQVRNYTMSQPITHSFSRNTHVWNAAIL